MVTIKNIYHPVTMHHNQNIYYKRTILSLSKKNTTHASVYDLQLSDFYDVLRFKTFCLSNNGKRNVNFIPTFLSRHYMYTFRYNIIFYYIIIIYTRAGSLSTSYISCTYVTPIWSPSEMKISQIPRERKRCITAETPEFIITRADLWRILEA